MELTTVPHRPPLVGRLWLLVAAAILVPVVLLVLLPAVLGLHRYVVMNDAMAGSLPRGSLTFAREVPGSDLRIGDIITFRPPAGYATGSRDPDRPADQLVTRRVADVTGAEIRTRADGSVGPDPWTLPIDSSRARVVAHVPYVGYPFLGSVDRRMWIMIASVPLVAVLLAVVGDLDRSRQRRRPPAALRVTES